MRDVVVVAVVARPGETASAAVDAAATAFAHRGAAVRTLAGRDCLPTRIDAALERIEGESGPINVCVIFAGGGANADSDAAEQGLRSVSTSAMQYMTSHGQGRLIHVRQSPLRPLKRPSRYGESMSHAANLTDQLRSQLERHHTGVTLSEIDLPTPCRTDAAAAAINAAARSGASRLRIRATTGRETAGTSRPPRRRRRRVLTRVW